MESSVDLIVASKSCRRILSMLCTLLALMNMVVEPAFPSVRDATSTLEEVKCVGLVISKTDQSKCQGTFLTQKHLATSCRCIGTTDSKTGIYTRGTPASYEAKSWSKGPEETKGVAKLYFHYNCGIEPNKILMDLGLVEASAPFSSGAVVPADLPDAQIFRFYEYIYRLQVLETRCLTTNLEAPAGSVLNATARHHMYCPQKNRCNDTVKTDCEFLLLRTNHICATPDVSSDVTTTTTTKAPSGSPAPSESPAPMYKPCTASGGAPLLCHKMLVGINARSATCEDPINSYMFIRIDYAMNWIMSNIC